MCLFLDDLFCKALGLSSYLICIVYVTETDFFSQGNVDFSALGFEQEAAILQEVMKSDCIVRYAMESKRISCSVLIICVADSCNWPQ